MTPSSSQPFLDPSRCPLCGEPNACAMACQGAGTATPACATPCWCEEAVFSEALLDRVPPAAKGRACVCANCAGTGTLTTQHNDKEAP
ncbi:cysteine-rich CWC family protein [Hydrogenophaga sp. 5NK40-0174]|uniref:cysteine-rich CWC family protein n=1 Tax=Hydrogenophaga sp. 5NK40-0174 TaxID=3127649 RepID=UPI003340CCD7